MVAKFPHDLGLPTSFGSGNLDVAMLSGDFRAVPELKCHSAIRGDHDLVDNRKPESFIPFRESERSFFDVSDKGVKRFGLSDTISLHRFQLINPLRRLAVTVKIAVIAFVEIGLIAAVRGGALLDVILGDGACTSRRAAPCQGHVLVPVNGGADGKHTGRGGLSIAPQGIGGYFPSRIIARAGGALRAYLISAKISARAWRGYGQTAGSGGRADGASKLPQREYRRVQRRYSKASTTPSKARSRLNTYSSIPKPPNIAVCNTR